mgnify:CR=1 FL=1
MIDPQITTRASTNLNKNDLKLDTKAPKTEQSPKESALVSSLKKNLGLNAATQERLANLGDGDLNLKLKSLVNKVLDQLFAKNSPSAKLASQQEKLNFAPNFSNEIKFLVSEMKKSDIFSELAGKLEQILKPASELKADNLAPLFKNSGVFFEAKLKDALNPNALPKSFHDLLSAIKSLSSPQIAAQIVELADKDLDPKSSLNQLQSILNAHKDENAKLLQSTPFKTLLALSAKLENFAHYISKNPNLAQEKLTQIATNILKGLQKLEPSFRQELARPENLTLPDTSVLKELNQAFNKLTQTLKALINGEKLNFSQTNSAQTPTNSPTNTPKPTLKSEFFESKENTSNSTNQANAGANLSANSPLLNDENTETKSPLPSQDDENKPNLNDKTAQNAQNAKDSANLKEPNSAQNAPKGENLSEKGSNLPPNADENENLQNTKTQNTPQSDNPKENLKPQNPLNQNDKTAQESAKNPPNSAAKADTNAPKTTPQTQSPQNATSSPLQENLNSEQAKQNQATQVKNLIFANEKAQMPELERLSKELAAVARKADESLKRLDLNAQNARVNLSDIKNIEHKIAQASKDLAQIAPKDMAQLSDELKNDIKSTLLQVANAAKDDGNEAVANQANRMLAQIEFNQLMSLANDSINTYLPLFWEDLNESRVIFKRGKKDKYYAQIKLNFAKLGELDIFIALKQDKYLDISIMAQDISFRKRIYEHSHELRRSLSKAGLLSSNLFVGDIIRSKLAPTSPQRDYEFSLGVDKRA